MTGYRRVFTIALALVGCAGEPDLSAASLPNVYGRDDRREWFEGGDRLSTTQRASVQRIAVETVGVFLRDGQVRLHDPDRVLLCGTNVADYPVGREDGCFARTLAWNVFNSSDFGQRMVPLCEDEAYALQPAIGRCSGTLIAEDLVLTSGHCFDEESDARTSVFVMNFRYDRAPESAGDLEWRTIADGREVPYWVEMPAPGLAAITRGDVYHVMDAHFVYETAARLRPSGSTTQSTVHDYAIVRLDRPVSLPRRPAPIRWAREHVAPGTPLVAVGFGKGMPLKIDDGASAIASWYCDPELNPAILCNLHDAYSGSSGSGLFTYEGVLVGAHRGSASDFVLDTTNACYRSKVLAEDVPDTDFPAAAHSVAWAVEEFCSNGFAPSSPLCGDPALRAARCDGDSIPNLGSEVCCQRTCARDEDCAVVDWGGRCGVDGYCRREAQCFAGELWERDACGRPLERLDGTAASCVTPGDACERAEVLDPSVDHVVPIPLTGFRDRSAGSCGGEHGPDRVFVVELAARTEVHLELDGDVLGWLFYLRSGGCQGDQEIVCSASDGAMDARFDGVLEPGVYHLFIDTELADARSDRPYGVIPHLRARFRIAPSPDAGVATMPPTDGCGCRSTGSPSRGGIALLLCLALAVRRRLGRPTCDGPHDGENDQDTME